MVIKAAIVGILYWLGMSRGNFLFCTVFRDPCFLGVVIGALYGNVKTGLMFGATIGMMTIGGIVAGGNITSDTCLSACVSIPVAITANMTPEAAAAVAVPLGLCGVYLNSIRRTINSWWVKQTDDAIESRNYKKANFTSFLGPWLGHFLLLFPPVFLANIVGVTFVADLVAKIPATLMNGLTVAGNVLPASGFALSLVIIGKKEYLPYFIIAYFLTALTSMTTLTACIFGICAALIAINKPQEE